MCMNLPVKERRKSNSRDVGLRQGVIFTGEKGQIYVSVEAAKRMHRRSILLCV